MPEVPASHRDLLDAPFATLGTRDGRGRPQLSQVCFLTEDGRVKISLNSARAKTRHLLSDPAATVLILDPQNPMRYLELAGEADIEEDVGKEFCARAGAKYGMDFTEHDAPGDTRYVVTLRPGRVYAANLG